MFIGGLETNHVIKSLLDSTNRSGTEVRENQVEVKDILEDETYVLNCIKRNGLVPFFQPIVNEKKEVVKYEALIRTYGEVGEVITPDRILAIKKNKLSEEYEEYYRKLLSGEYSIPLSVNLDLHLLQSQAYSEFMKSNISTSQIDFEVLETMTHRQVKQEYKSKLQLVRDSGLSIGLDDFPENYSNLNRVSYLKPDFVKFDGSVLEGLCTSQMRQAMMRTMIKLFKLQGITTICEKVETTAEFEYLKYLGIDLFQGYLFSRPVPFDQLNLQKNKKTKSLDQVK